MYSREESLKPLKKPVKNSKGKILKKNGKTIYKTVYVPSFEKNDTFKLTLGPDKEETTVFVRKCKPVKQVINMTEEAYLAMIDKKAPYNYKDKKIPWSTLTKNQRIKWHCMQIASQMGGMFDSFQVLN